MIGEGPAAKVEVNETALEKLRWIDNALVGESTVDLNLKQSGLSMCTVMGRSKVGKSELLNKVLGREEKDTKVRSLFEYLFLLVSRQ